ncbi:hypothetical protein Stube_12250 [Streptomyces tubercidicus]|uniref:Uncharacterized protein n=1 Tax=Streptomyces tubercidicus TaxID=47759 RepID=A0A640UML0_9ACTN|nr:hypothetical protein Stube_12250 [Streptomyces tubercidicus]
MDTVYRMVVDSVYSVRAPPLAAADKCDGRRVRAWRPPPPPPPPPSGEGAGVGSGVGGSHPAEVRKRSTQPPGRSALAQHPATQPEFTAHTTTPTVAPRGGGRGGRRVVLRGQMVT